MLRRLSSWLASNYIVVYENVNLRLTGAYPQETAADHPSDHPDYDPEAEEVEIIEALPEDDDDHHHHHHHGEHIDIIDAHRPSSVD